MIGDPVIALPFVEDGQSRMLWILAHKAKKL